MIGAGETRQRDGRNAAAPIGFERRDLADEQIAVAVRRGAIADEHIRPPAFERVERVRHGFRRPHGCSTLPQHRFEQLAGVTVPVEHEHAQPLEHLELRAHDIDGTPARSRSSLLAEGEIEP